MNINSARSRFSLAFARTRTWVARHPWRLVLALPALVLAYVLVLIPFTPSIGDIRKAKQEQPTVVLSADGKELAVYKRANRDWVKLDEISPTAVAALLATEDRRFYDHPGIDVVRTAKAVLNTVRGDREGGSTITQQLARNLYPEEIGRAPTVTRKVKEAITALKIEAVYSKDEILETYLNSVPFLYNAFGIEAAAQTYFDKPARKLDELESATLIGMLKGTSYYNPVLNPERALERRNTVLAQMVKNEKLSEARYERLKAQPLKLDFERLPEFTGPAPHLAEYLRKWLIDWADRNDYNIYADGLVVRTTIDSRLQDLANQAVTEQMEQLQAVADVEWSRSGLASHGIQTSAYVAQRGKVKPFEYFWNSRPQLLDAFIRDSSQYKLAREQGQSEEEALQRLRADADFMKELREERTRLQAGFFAIEPATGRVKAWVGSRDYNQDKFDHVQQARRQPGSTFKPFVYGAAFEQGIPPNETLMDAPVSIQIDRNKFWRPGDVGDGPTNRPMTLREGLSRSKNTITAQLMMRVGPQRVESLARAMGVRQSPLEAVPSLALGTSPVTLKEMVTSFGTIANGGSYIEPVVVTSIEDRNGNTLESFGPPAAESAISPSSAMALLDVMRGVIDEGTAVGLRSRFGITGDVAGKTGTTQGNTDGWFILMHPQLVAGAWVGFNDNRVTMRSDYWGQGAHNALLVVGDFYKQAFERKVLDAQAKFAVPRMKDQEQPLMDRVNDWFNSVFNSAPPAEPEAAVAEAPEVKFELPQLEPPPSLPPASPSAAIAEVRPAPAGVAPDAPVIAGDQRVPEFPRPLDMAQPAETIPGTQVYRTPDSGTRSADEGRAGARSEPVFVPRPWGSDGATANASPRASGSGAGSDTSVLGAPSRPAGGAGASVGADNSRGSGSSGSDSAGAASSGSASGASGFFSGGAPSGATATVKAPRGSSERASSLGGSDTAASSRSSSGGFAPEADTNLSSASSADATSAFGASAGSSAESSSSGSAVREATGSATAETE